MGFFRLKRNENQLGIETLCSWATPLSFTQHNTPCDLDGGNCAATSSSTESTNRAEAAAVVVDPSADVATFRQARGLPVRT